MCYTLHMQTELVEWLNDEVQARGWNYAELCRRAGVADSSLSLVMSERRRPTCDFCVKIAGALGMRPERLLRIAGLLPPLAPPVQEEDEVIETMRRLGATDRDALIRMLRGLSGGGTVPRTPRQVASSIVAEPRPPERRTREELLHYVAERLQELVDPKDYPLLITMLRHFAQTPEQQGEHETMESAR